MMVSVALRQPAALVAALLCALPRLAHGSQGRALSRIAGVVLIGSLVTIRLTTLRN
jgi:hypothetical protein